MNLNDLLKRKKVIYFLTILIILISISIFSFLYFHLTKFTLSLVKPLEPPSKLSPPTPSNEVILSEFEKCLEGEIKIDISNDWKDLYYLIAQALITKNRDTCLTVENQNAKEICVNEFNEFMSILDAQKRECKNNDDLCLFLLTKDIKFCSEIKDPIEKATCEAIVNSNPAYCENLSGAFESEEVCKKVIGKKEIKKGCGKIDQEEARSLCFNTFYIIKALTEKNIELCKKIDFETGKFTFLHCQVLLSKNPEKALKDFYREHACYERYATRIAKIKNDPSICEKIPLKDSHNKIEYENCKNQFK